MNKRQVVKVSYDEETHYGICLDENAGKLFLDTGQVLHDDVLGTLILRIGYDEMRNERQVENVEISNTRNVPLSVRELLEEAYYAYNEAVTLLNKIEPLQTRLEQRRDVIYNVKDEIDAAIRKENGLLSNLEFARAFYENLKGNVAVLVDESQRKHVGYHATIEPFDVKFSYDEKELLLSREIPVQKYFRKSSFTYEQYDGEIYLRDDAEQNSEYQQYISKYSSKLPVKNYESEERLYVGGDKDFLTYNIVYRIPVTKPLTEEYAIKLAAAFSEDKRLDKTKSKKKDDYER